MEVTTNKTPNSVTPSKGNPLGIRCKNHEITRLSENSNPNLHPSRSLNNLKPEESPLTKSGKTHKSASKIQTLNKNPAVDSLQNKIKERKFVVAKKKKKKKKNSRKEEGVGSVSNVECKRKERFAGGVKKCLCVAYETLRASQEEFFNTRNGAEEAKGEEGGEKGFECGAEIEVEDEEMEKCSMPQKLEIGDGYAVDDVNLGEAEEWGQTGISPTIKRRRDKLLEDARTSVPKCGKVMHLVKAFENLSTIQKELDKNEENGENKEDNEKKAMQWALPGLLAPKVSDTPGSSSSFCPSDCFLTSENLGLDSRLSVSSSWDGSQGSVSSRTANRGRRSRRNSSESHGVVGGRRWKKKQLKLTCQKPFKLRTEQRGRTKEEKFTMKIQEMMVEEERQRIPIAQGLPWTTDEPEVRPLS